MGINQEKQVWVIGHKNPDTDSICAAIAYAELKNQTSEIRQNALGILMKKRNMY